MLEKINGTIKHYAWGGFDFIPNLLNQDNASNEPFAEYWLGTHPDGDAKLKNGNSRTLGKIVKDLSGAGIAGGSLSFLLKVLDVRNMLSIQLHPDKATAEKGFEHEEREGVERNAFNRVYKDQNHKPELMVALSDFWLVQGFKSESAICKALQHHPELTALIPYLNNGGIKGLYEQIMTAPQQEINNILKPIGQRIKPLYEAGKLSREDIDFWVARAFLTFNRKGVCDRGILSLYLMNLVNLKPGEGCYQAPGVLHAYMEGQNIECMATSDNVIRGGLTQKHVDTAKLLEITSFTSSEPLIVYPKKVGSINSYDTPAPDFRLRTMTSEGTYGMDSAFPRIIMVLEGSCTVTSDRQQMQLGHGESCFIFDEPTCTLNMKQNGLTVIAEEGI